MYNVKMYNLIIILLLFKKKFLYLLKDCFESILLYILVVYISINIYIILNIWFLKNKHEELRNVTNYFLK